MEISIAAEKLFMLGVLPVTNALFIGVLVSVILVLVTQIILTRWQSVPRGLQNVFEIIVDGVLGLLESIMQDRGMARKFFPLIATIFLFILLSNWIGLLPGLGTVGLAHENAAGHATIIPFLRSTSADLNFTLGLSLCCHHDTADGYSGSWYSWVREEIFCQSVSQTLCGRDAYGSARTCFGIRQDSLFRFSVVWQCLCGRNSVDSDASSGALFYSAPIPFSGDFCWIHSGSSFRDARGGLSQNGYHASRTLGGEVNGHV